MHWSQHSRLWMVCLVSTTLAVGMGHAQEQQPSSSATRLIILTNASDDAAESRDPVLIEEVEPIYPRRAQTRGIEGYVVISTTITTSGSVRDPIVVESEPPGIFDRAAVDAVLQYRYLPARRDGKHVSFEGLEVRVEFEID